LYLIPAATQEISENSLDFLRMRIIILRGRIFEERGMARWITAQVSDEADLKLKLIEIRLRKLDPGATRPMAIEAAILAADVEAVERAFGASLDSTRPAP